MRQQFEKTATIVNTRNDQAVEAEVDDIRVNESLNAFIAIIEMFQIGISGTFDRFAFNTKIM